MPSCARDRWSMSRRLELGTCWRSPGRVASRCSSLRERSDDCRRERCFHSPRRLGGVIVLPDPDHRPAEIFQMSVGRPVALLVPSKLVRLPELVVRRVRRVDRAHVPEAAVHEDGDLRAREDDVCSASRRLGKGALDAEPSTTGVQRPAQRGLRSGISASLTAHASTCLGGRRQPAVGHACHGDTSAPTRSHKATRWLAKLARVEYSGRAWVDP